ncbi:hypothetical protein JG688_00013795 [Phytophthora aleatoria]|uniref:Histone H4 n=1 Tax=Phytophthora aleatoria TaxID=2496075 RepID=A0A8J5MDS3_9STRA|nr:hypothetical protein JG688_00013795 [Phytophthora aleatoria]
MAGQGNGAQELGTGGTKRHRNIFRDNIQGITRSTIRRLARRSGVIQMSGLMHLLQLLGYVMQAIFFISSRSSKAAETKSNINQKQQKPKQGSYKLGLTPGRACPGVLIYFTVIFESSYKP